MILQALKDYYDRKAADPESGIAPMGFEWKEIPFVLAIDETGRLVNVENTTEGQGKQRRAKRFLVPQAVKRSVNVLANLLWDNPEYSLGMALKGKPERVEEQHRSFRERIESLGANGDAGVSAVLRFLSCADRIEQARSFGEAWEEMTKHSANLTFRLAGDAALVAERSEVVRRYLATSAAQETGSDICLITGQTGPVADLHPPIKGVFGAKSTGANVVSFNLAPFCSYGKTQGGNAPASREAVFAYTTALNHLLSRDSRRRLQIGDATTVFWADRPTPLEMQVRDIFDEPPKDDPDRLTQAVEALFKSVRSGAYVEDDGPTRFFVLGLAPNSARIAVRFWIADTVARMAERIRRHFLDVEIVHGPKEPPHPSLKRLLRSIALLEKDENIPPNLAGDTMRAILEGLPYPATLLQAAVRRSRAEQGVTYARAALIKACLNREDRRNPNHAEEELTVSLDENNANIGYRLGRLFAVLERIQQDATPGLNATIRDRFYGAASSAPVTVFGNLMRLSNHHLSKLEKEKPGLAVRRKQTLGEIFCAVPDFPVHLALADQGRFAIGYYHQMQKFYEKKSDKPTTEESNP